MIHHQWWWVLLLLPFCSSSSEEIFIVRLQNGPSPSTVDVESWYRSTLNTLESDPSTTGTGGTGGGVGKELIHMYKTIFQGFAARITKEQAEQLESLPHVLSVLPDRVYHLHTTRSPEFLGLREGDKAGGGILKESDFGSNAIIGVLDTGIWPERRSFHDEGMDAVPSRWRGECVEGERFSKSMCNRKLIGARYFTAGYEGDDGGGEFNQTAELKSARDTDGHGTHTASTAAGRQVSEASFFGLAKGEAMGIAPKARIAVYKVCWLRGCLSSDILAGFDKAVEDGVDIISLSVGGGATPSYLDPISLGSFAAMEKNILVSASAGNDGPTPQTLSNVAPWITTVGASTIDRAFPVDLILEHGPLLEGASLYHGNELPENVFFPLIYAGNASEQGFLPSGFCLPNTLKKELVRGRIVVCDRGGVKRAAKSMAVKRAGGVGTVIANMYPLGQGLIADAHLSPAMAITETAAFQLKKYISQTSTPRAKMVFRGTRMGVKPAPVVASFSSRGPNAVSPYILKPDVIAPGVNILAAWPEGVSPTGIPEDERSTEFNIISGTSMSCPHVSGLAALLRGAHPEWSAAMVRSAIMTTAKSEDGEGRRVLDERWYNVSSVWDTGAGEVDPERTVDPGLVYDMGVEEYLNFLCASGVKREDVATIARRDVKCEKRPGKAWDVNYPSVAVGVVVEEEGGGEEGGEVVFVVRRMVTHVREGGGNYTVGVVGMENARVVVKPRRLEFKNKGERQKYRVRITAKRRRRGGEMASVNYVTESGSLTWSDGRRRVTSQISVTWAGRKVSGGTA